MDEIENRDDELGTGATGESEALELDADTGADALGDDEIVGDDEVAGGDLPDAGEDEAAVDDAENALYEITGLVDYTDEQGNITGQHPIGSVQSLPVAFGDEAVRDGRAIRVE